MNTHKKKISQDDTDSLQVSVLTKQKILSRKMRKKLTRIKKTSQIPTNSPTKPTVYGKEGQVEIISTSTI
jgi:hypothetical protein